MSTTDLTARIREAVNSTPAPETMHRFDVPTEGCECAVCALHRVTAAVLELCDGDSERDDIRAGVATALGVPTGSEQPCGCYACQEPHFPEFLSGHPDSRFQPYPILCQTCGNKRCPHAAHHDNPCTGSNAIGQPGRRYPALGVPTESEPVDDGRHYAVIAPGYTVCRQSWNVARYTQSKIGGRIVLLDADGATHPVCGTCGASTESEPCREHQGGGRDD